jgi:hypothetical protein
LSERQPSALPAIALFVAVALYVAVSAIGVVRFASHLDLILTVAQCCVLIPAGVWFVYTRRGDTAGTLPRVPVTAAAVVFAAAVIFGSIQMHAGIYGADESAYRFQARIFAAHRITVPAPPLDNTVEIGDPQIRFWFNNVVRRDGKWFGKYPPGWPAALSLMHGIPQETALNPILAIVVIILTWKIATALFDRATAELAVFILCLTPFFWFYSGGYLSHTLCGVFCAGAMLAGIRASSSRRTFDFFLMFALIALAFLVRPFTAVCFGGALFAWLAFHVRLSLRGLVFTGLAAAVSFGTAIAVTLLFNRATTGSYWLSGYTIYRPGKAFVELNFRPSALLHNLAVLTRWSSERMLVWTFPGTLPFACAAVMWARKRSSAVLLAAVTLAVVAGYVGMTEPSYSFFGERYYYEIAFALAILAAAGLRLLVDRFRLSQQSIHVFTAAILIIVAVQMATFVWIGAGWHNPFPSIRTAAKQYPDSVIFLAGNGPFEPRNFNENEADWPNAPQIYIEDPGPELRAAVARSVRRQKWAVITYDIAERQAKVLEAHQ